MKFTKQFYEVKEGIAYIYDKNDIVFTVDETDLSKMQRFGRVWVCFKTKRSAGKYYVHSNLNGGTVYLHRFLIDAPKGIQVDHIDGNPLNNCRSNLRIVTDSENKQNRHKLDNRNKSGYRGVFWNNQHKKWSAKLQINNKQYHVGHFDDVHEAGQAAAEARRQFMTHAQESQAKESLADWVKPKKDKTKTSKSGIHGVCYNKQTGRWMAILTKNGESKYIGSYETTEEAAKAVEDAKTISFEEIPKAIHPQILNNRSGVRGVRWDESRNKWAASLNKKYLGRFNTIEEAAESVKQARDRQ